MKHWIVNRDAARLPNWAEAFPDGLVLTRELEVQIPPGEAGIVWWRQRTGEPVEAVLPPPAEQMRRYVVLCDEPEASAVMDAIARGAAGCCNTHAAPEVLNQVALVVANGGLWVGQSLLQRLVGGSARALAQREDAARNDAWTKLLSEREIQVARLVAGGASNKEIANQLAISERTVKAHLTSVFEKLSLRDRLQLSLKVNGLEI